MEANICIEDMVIDMAVGEGHGGGAVGDIQCGEGGGDLGLTIVLAAAYFTLCPSFYSHS